VLVLINLQTCKPAAFSTFVCVILNLCSWNLVHASFSPSADCGNLPPCLFKVTDAESALDDNVFTRTCRVCRGPLAIEHYVHQKKPLCLPCLVAAVGGTQAEASSERRAKKAKLFANEDQAPVRVKRVVWVARDKLP
jgi:hypothetical protein